MKMNTCYSYLSENIKTFYTKHSHKDMWEIIYITSGNATLVIDEKIYEVENGDIAIIPPGIVHHGFSKSVFGDHYIHVKNINYHGLTVTHDYDNVILQLMLMIDKALNHKEKNYEHICDRLVDALCEYIIKYSAYTSKNKFLVGFKDKIHENISNPDFKISEEINNTGYNPDYVRRSFKTEFEYTPHEYLTNLRLEKAAGMLLNVCPGDIKTVCRESGFNDVSYFSRIFKKKYGTTPQDFKNIDVIPTNIITDTAKNRESTAPVVSSTANEQFTLIPQVDKLPFNVVISGKTYPDPDYHLVRENSPMFVAIYVISGKGTIVDNEKITNFKTGDLFILPIDYSHEFFSDKDEPFSAIWFNCVGSLAKYLPQIYGIDKIIVFPNSNGKKYIYAITETCQNPAISIEDKQIYCSELFFRLVHLLSSSQRSTSENHIDASALKTYIDNHIKEQINLGNLAKVINRSVSQTLRVFKAEYNCTPYEYILNQKMTLAKYLLLSSDMKIKEISDELSFKDEHHFSTLFKSKNKYTPTQFRKMKNKNLNYGHLI